MSNAYIDQIERDLESFMFNISKELNQSPFAQQCSEHKIINGCDTLERHMYHMGKLQAAKEFKQYLQNFKNNNK